MTLKHAGWWLVVSLALAAVVVAGAVALGLALIAAPVVLLAGYLLAGQRRSRRATGLRREGPSVYEGEFRVLDEEPQSAEKGS